MTDAYIDSSKDPILKNCPLLSPYLPSAFVFSQQAAGLLQDASLSHPKRIKFKLNNLGSISTEKEAIRARLIERLIPRSPRMSRPEKCTLEHEKKRKRSHMKKTASTDKVSYVRLKRLKRLIKKHPKLQDPRFEYLKIGKE